LSLLVFKARRRIEFQPVQTDAHPHRQKLPQKINPKSLSYFSTIKPTRQLPTSTTHPPQLPPQKHHNKTRTFQKTPAKTLFRHNKKNRQKTKPQSN
jgi:hypothetical protein